MISTKRVQLAFLGVLLSCHALPLQESIQADSWTQLADITSGSLREYSAVALSQTKFATIGGVITGGGTTDALQFYDTQTNTWSKGAKVPVPVNHPNAAVVDGKIYFLGGFTVTDPPTGWKATGTAAVYDPVADSWQALEQLPSAQIRGASAMGVYNRTIYVAGGKAGSGASSVTTVSAFSVDTKKWITLPESASRIPGPRDHVGGAVVGSKFYVIGGRDTAINNVKGDVYILDFENVAAGWVTSTVKMPTARGGLAVAAIGTKIYTFGGEGNQAANSRGVFPQTEVYDTTTDSWTSLQAMKTPRHGIYAAAVGGKVYIAGGATGSGAGDSNILEAYSP